MVWKIYLNWHHLGSQLTFLTNQVEPRNLANYAPCFATRAGFSARTACGSSSPPSRIEHATRHELTPEKQQWLEWAKTKVDWLDPLVRRSDPILDAPEPEAPSYWRF